MRIIENMHRAGLTNFLIVIKPEFEKMFRDVIPASFNVTFVHQITASGMTDAILSTRPYIKGDFVVCAGDMIVPEDHVADVVRVHEKQKPFGTLSLFKASIDYVKGMGNVKLDATGTVIKIIEKPPKEQLLSNMYSLPFYVFKAEIFNYLDKCPVSSRGERELQDAIQMAITDKQIVKGVVLNRVFSRDEQEFWRELSSLNITNGKDYFNTCMDVLAGMGVRVPFDLMCTLIEPVMVKENCTISDNALLGPNVIIGKNVSIDSLAEISHAIIQDDCKIGKRCVIDHVIIMAGANIKDGTEIKCKAPEILIIEK